MFRYDVFALFCRKKPFLNQQIITFLHCFTKRNNLTLRHTTLHVGHLLYEFKQVNVVFQCS